jgi:hypothetical protein
MARARFTAWATEPAEKFHFSGGESPQFFRRNWRRFVYFVVCFTLTPLAVLQSLHVR